MELEWRGVWSCGMWSMNLECGGGVWSMELECGAYCVLAVLLVLFLSKRKYNQS